MCLFIISLNLFQIIIVSVWKSFCLFVYFFELYFVWLFPLWALYYLFLVFNVYFLNKRIKSVWSVFFFHWNQWSDTLGISYYTSHGPKNIAIGLWKTNAIYSGQMSHVFISFRPIDQVHMLKRTHGTMNPVC